MAQTPPSQQLQAGVQVLNPFELETDLGPYATVAEANAAIITAKRFPGKKIKIVVANVPTEYWWSGGIADVNLIAISTGSAGLTSFNGRTAAAAVFLLSDLPALTGYAALAGVVSATDTPLTAIQKLDGNVQSLNKEVGIVYSEAFAAGTVATNYNKTGAIATFTEAVGKIIVDGGVGDWIQSISLKNFKLANSKQTNRYRYTVKTLNTMGVGFGIKTNPFDLRFHLDQTVSGASYIRLYLNSIEISNQIRTTAQTMSVALNDVIEMTWKQVGSDTYITYTNTNPATIQKLQYVYRHVNNSAVAPIAYSIGSPTIYALAGQVEITQADTTDNNQVSPDYIFVWDSIGRGGDALSDEYSWFSLLLKSGVNAVMLSAPGGSLDDFNVTAFLNTLNLYSKKAIVVNGLGTNGVESDGGSTTYTKYSAFNTAISALGFTVQSATLMGATANVNTFNASVRANIADYYDIQAIVPDRIGLHPTLSGSRQIAREMLNKVKTSRNVTNSDLLDYVVFRNRIVNSNTAMTLGFTPTATFTTSSTTITTGAIPTGFPTSGICKIVKTSTGESEFVEYNAKSGTQIIGLKRAQFGSVAISTSVANDAYVSFVHQIWNGADNSTPSFHTAGLGSGLMGAHYNGYGLTPKDAFSFGLSDADIFRIKSTGTAQISVVRNSGASFAKISLDVIVSGSPREGYGMFVNTSNNFSLLRATSGTTLDDSVPLFSSNTSGNLSFGLHSKTYRLTNGGADVTSDFLIHPTKNTVATVKKYALDHANGFVLIDVNNGNIPIATASLKTNIINNAAGLETSELGLYTQNAGTGLGLRAVINATGLSTIHLQGQGSSPTIAAGAGAGTGPTITITKATDLSGVITVTTGTLPTLGAVIATVTFAIPFTAAPKVILYNSGANSAALSGASMVYVGDANTTALKFDLISGGTPLNAATPYTFTYFVTQ